MKLEYQVCTRGQGKRLEELGVDGSSCILFWDTHDTKVVLSLANSHPFISEFGSQSYPAFTVAELGVLLPDGVLTMRKFGSVGFRLDTGGPYWECSSKEYNATYEVTQAQCMAAMLIHLLESNLITPDQINERIK